MDKYRIPAMIYAPSFIKPQKIDKLVSQIDLMPTVFGLLHFTYNSKFYGKNVFDIDYDNRAFIATYQDLGYIKNNSLTIISTKQRVKQFNLKLQNKYDDKINIYYDEIPVKKLNENMKNEAISYYQSVSYFLKKNKLNFLKLKLLNLSNNHLYLVKNVFYFELERQYHLQFHHQNIPPKSYTSQSSPFQQAFQLSKPSHQFLLHF